MTVIPGKHKLHADPLVLSTAQGIAEEMFVTFITAGSKGNELYENMKVANPGRDNVWLQERFVRRMTPLLLNEARATLARLLGVTKEKDLQDKIHCALVRDSTLRMADGKRI